jgi:hypothetical protein
MVGSGKSTAGARIHDALTAAGMKPQYLRFRYLRLVGFRTPSSSRPRAEGTDDQSEAIRGRGFQLRTLTAILTLGYAARIVAFRLAKIGGPGRCDVLDRYFYDNFVHYRLTSRRERLYARLLRRLIPRPDLAVLLIASAETLATRRPNYSNEYLVTVARRYETLPELFPWLVQVRTDVGSPDGDVLDRSIRALVEAAPTTG